MIAIRALVFFICCSAVFANERKVSETFLEKVDVGKSARLRAIEGKYEVTIYSKGRKLEILAAHQKRLRELKKAKAAAGRKRDRMVMLAQPPATAGLQQVIEVGPDFIAFSVSDSTRVTLVPVWSIRNLIFEQTVEETNLADAAFGGPRQPVGNDNSLK